MQRSGGVGKLLKKLILVLGLLLATSAFADGKSGRGDPNGKAGCDKAGDFYLDSDTGTGWHCLTPGDKKWYPSGGTVNVKSFGAVGDGMADDTAEITAAIASLGTVSCNDGSGGVVFLPRGDYGVTTTVNVPRCVLLKGEHRTATTISALPAFGPGSAPVISLCQEDVAQNGHGCAIEAISIDQNDLADWGVMTTNAQEGAFIRDFVIRRVDIYGIYLKARAGTDPGIHTVAISDGEIYFDSTASGDKGIYIQSNTFGPADLLFNRITITAPTVVAGTSAVQIEQAGVSINELHIEGFTTGNRVGANNVAINQVRCTSPMVTCNLLESGSGSTASVIASHADAGVTTNVQDDVRSLSLTAEYVPSYFQTLQAGVRLAPPVGTTTTIVCAAAFEGSLFYDTDARTSASPGALCVCNPLAGVYRWHPVEPDVAGDAGVPINLTGNSTTDCGT